MTLDPWIEEFRFQISLAESIWKSSLTGKERISFILLDNIIEFMCKAYLKAVRGLVGKGKRHRIAPNDWEDISRYFDNLMAATRLHSPIPGTVLDSIETYHKVRNDLYHTAMPMAVTRAQFKDELKNAIVVFETLYQQAYSSLTIDVETEIHGKPSLDEMVSVVGPDQHIRMSYDGDLSLAQWIRTAIHGYATLLGTTPTVEKIQRTLAISHQATDEKKVRQCFSKLKYDGHVTEEPDGTYSLTKEGFDALQRNR